MDRRALHLVVRTPHAVVVECCALGLRVPTESGQVGIRPGGERTVTPIEPGLAIARTPGGAIYLATAGGLLRSDALRAVLMTPVAFAGSEPEAVLREIEVASGAEDPERDLRRAIERLEAGMLRELRASHGEGSPAWSGGGERRAGRR